MLLFTTKANLNAMKIASKAFSDGTFSVVPKLFYQLYTLHVEVQQLVLPVAYFLLPNKRKATYESALRKINEICPEFETTEVMTGMEIAATNAYESVYPSAHIKACFFHMSQALYRKIQQFPAINR